MTTDEEREVDEEGAVNEIYIAQRRLALSEGVPRVDSRTHALTVIRNELDDLSMVWRVKPEVIDRVLTARFGADWGKPGGKKEEGQV